MNGLLMRRRAMMAGKAALTPTTLYPFPNNSEGRYTITNGNRLKVSSGNVISNQTVNLYALTSTINNLPERFVIPAGSTVRFVYQVSDISRYGTTGRVSFGLRKANTTQNLSYGSGNITQTGDFVAEFTAATDDSASCMYAYFNGIYALTVDIFMYVDGERWI